MALSTRRVVPVLFSALLGAALLGCGAKGGDSSASASSPVSSSSSSPGKSSSSAASVTSAGPSKTVDPAVPSSPVFKAIRTGAMHAGYLDVKSLREREWFKGAVAAVESQEQIKPFLQMMSRCGGNPVEMVDEIAWSGEKKETAVAAKLAVPADKVIACISGLGGPKKKVDGNKTIFSQGDIVAIIDGDMLYGGTTAWANDLAGGKAPTDQALAAKVAPGADQLLKAHVGLEGMPGSPVKGIDLSVFSAAAKLELTTVVEATSEEAATGMEKKVQETLAEAKASTPELPDVKVERKGASLTVSVSAEGGAEPQVKLVGTLSALAIYSVQGYLTSAKTSEVKNTVGAISRSIMASVEDSPDHKFPPSSSLVPAEIPKGKKAMTTPADWSGSWKTIKFEMGTPQYYRYHFVTSPDGSSCDVIGEGDLNGDGKTSRFTMHLTRSAAGEVHMDSKLQIENERE